MVYFSTRSINSTGYFNVLVSKRREINTKKRADVVSDLTHDNHKTSLINIGMQGVEELFFL